MTEAPSDSFDGVATDALAALWGVPSVEAWTEIGSTNDRAADLARSSAPRGTVVLAERQLAGRGRRGAVWHSAPGSGLWMSVVLDRSDAFDPLPLLVGVACAEAIEDRTGVAVGVKWPNDLLVEGRKLGGILVERHAGRVVVGIGINLRAPDGGFPPEIRGRAVTLESRLGAGDVPRPSALAETIVKRLLARLDETDAVATAIEALRERDALLGRRVRTEQEGTGEARGIDPDGALVLERDDGSRVRVVSGSVQLEGG